jgi:hypothetical protein
MACALVGARALDSETEEADGALYIVAALCARRAADPSVSLREREDWISIHERCKGGLLIQRRRGPRGGLRLVQARYWRIRYESARENLRKTIRRDRLGRPIAPSEEVVRLWLEEVCPAHSDEDIAAVRLDLGLRTPTWYPLIEVLARGAGLGSPTAFKKQVLAPSRKRLGIRRA